MLLPWWTGNRVIYNGGTTAVPYPVVVPGQNTIVPVPVTATQPGYTLPNAAIPQGVPAR